MKVLVVGSGGREHTLVWKIARSPTVDKIFAAPGNAGISQSAECHQVKADDIDGLLKLAREKDIDLTVVGPEVPLVEGIADRFRMEGRRIFGFTSKGARLEGSKVWAKEFMRRNGIPTGDFGVFEQVSPAMDYLKSLEPPHVIKVDGLAAGKGVLVCSDRDQAEKGLDRIFRKGDFGRAGDKVVIEEFLSGQEISILSVFDGKDYRLFVPSQDHKRAYDGDKGPNTGGMGAYAPVPAYDSGLALKVKEKIIEPTFEGMKREGIAEGAGVLYFGLMITGEGPKVLEYNCRFGDPETQVVLPLFESDLLDVMDNAVNGALAAADFRNSSDSAGCVVVASGGYPGSYEKGHEITGIEEARKSGCLVFHAGTSRKDERLVTSGGRVLGVAATSSSLEKALDKAYEGVDIISFKDCFSRRDIGGKAL